jgi:lipopolysaccharide transport system ATP-binding protein
MQVRLAFAVAAHLEPEVLVVDEVLAVGDARFQKKCLGRMRHVAAEDGRTVLFVSHNLGALSSLCTRGVVLDGGRVQSDTDIHGALATYVNATMMHVANPNQPATKARIQSVTLDERALRQGTLVARIAFVSPFELEPPIGGITVTDANGVPVLGTNARMHPDGYAGHSAQSGVLVCRIPNLPLHSGEYLLDAWLGDMHEDYDAEIGVLSFYFTSAEFRPNMPPVSAIGAVNVDATWAFEPMLEDAVVNS